MIYIISEVLRNLLPICDRACDKVSFVEGR